MVYITTFGICPYCGHPEIFETQTDDLSKESFSFYHFHTLDGNWFDKKNKLLGKEFRKAIPCFNSFPLDKDEKVWKNQAEKIEAKAQVPKEFKHLKFVNVYTSCKSIQCQFDGDRWWICRQSCPSGFSRGFDGKIRIKNGFLIGGIYDIKKDDWKEKDLDKYKKKDPELFKRLLKKYKHEPIACRNWHDISVFTKKELEKRIKKQKEERVEAIKRIQKRFSTKNVGRE